MRNSLIGDTIPRDHLMGALGLARTTMDSARVTGALAGAGLSSTLGIGGAYAFVASFYVASLALTLGVSRARPVADPGDGRVGIRPGARVPAVPRASGWRDLAEGVVYVWSTPRLLATMCLAFLVNLTAYPVSSGLLPYVARNVYHTDAAGLGWLMASFSFGALLGSVAMVLAGRTRHSERAMIVSTLLWYALLLAFGLAPGAAAGGAALMLAGMVQSVAMIAMAVSLLRAASDRFRARVMGVRTLAVYGLPLGLMASGALITRMGFVNTVILSCTVGLLLTALIRARWRESLWSA
jgi:predicted MFS family arabinose efflux permease